MQRRRVLAGLAAGMTFLAGCNSNGGGGGGNNTTQPATDATGTPLAPDDAGTSTPAATTVAETARETATQTAIATATTTPTPTSSTATMGTAGPTATGTAGPSTATGLMDVDLSDRETYSNDTYSYTIEYPAGWSVDESDPTSVSFSPSGSPASIGVFAQGDIPSSATLDQAARNFLSGYQQTVGGQGSSTEILNQQDVTLPNDNPARLFDFRLSSSSAGISVRQKVIITLANNTLYAATIAIPEAAYTSSVGEQADEMLTSLTVSSGPTGTTSG